MALISRRYPLQDGHSCQNKVQHVTFYLLPVTCYLLPVTCYLLPITCYLLPVTCYLLPVTYYLLPVTCYLLPVTCYLLPVTGFFSTDSFPGFFFPRFCSPDFLLRMCSRIVFPDFRSQRCPGLNFQAPIRKKIPTL